MIFNTFATAKTSTGILSTTSSSDTDFGSFKNWILLSLVALSRLIHLRKYFLSLEHVPISAVALKTVGRSKIVSLDNLNGIKEIRIHQHMKFALTNEAKDIPFATVVSFRALIKVAFPANVRQPKKLPYLS